jgi:hypothetical protein
MLQDAGRFEVTDEAAAAMVVEWALGSAPTPSARWSNLTLEVDEERFIPDNVMFSIVAARGPSVPMATVTAATSGKREEPAAVGIEHRAGTKAGVQLREAGMETPPEWRLVQDHPRRGLVFTLPAEVDTTVLARWILDALRVLNRAPVLSGVTYESYATN